MNKWVVALLVTPLVAAALLIMLVIGARAVHAQTQTCNYWPWGYQGSMGTSQCYYGGSLGPEADACPSCLKWPAP